MPDSMMMAPTASRLKVSGSSMATAATGPMPGSTPTRVPTSTPMKQYQRFISETAVEKPNDRFGISCEKSMLSPPEQGVGQFDAVNEDADRTRDEHHAQKQHFFYPEHLACRRAQHD